MSDPHLRIDINCDMGESYGNFQIGNDDAIFPFITSCNVACGFHGGDPVHIEKTIRKAIDYGLQIGAHPSYPDLSGFGRRKMIIPNDELRAIVKYQIVLIKGLAESLGGKLSYVKPHGALYNSAAHNKDEAMAIFSAIHETDPSLILMGLAGSQMQQDAIEKGLSFVAEAFADRRYEQNGSLRPRTLAGAVLTNPEEAANQVVAIVKNREVETIEGQKVQVLAESVCIHGDNAMAPAILKEVDRRLRAENIAKLGFTQ